MKSRTLIQLIESNCRQNAEKIFVTEREGNQLVNRTYSQLKSDMDKLAAYLKHHVGSGKKIALAGENSYQWILVYLSVIYSGNIILPLDYRTLESKTDSLFRTMDVSLLFIQHKYVTDEIISELSCEKIEILSDSNGKLDEILGQKAITDSECKSKLVQETDICTILFTSGTTSKSKGVVLTHEQLYSNICSLGNRMNETMGEKGYGVLPLFHAFALLCDLWRTIYLGTSFFVLREMKYFFQELTLYEPDYIFLVPEIAESMLKELKRQHKSYPKKEVTRVGQGIWGKNLGVLISGGAAISPSLVDEFEKAGVRLLRGYGMTECSPVIAAMSPTEYVDNKTVGKPLDCNEVEIQDGEICVKGMNVMQGYYCDPEETSKALRDGWLHTGDAGYLSKDGYLYITGRKKEIIVLKNGENISPSSIESIFREKDFINDAVVYSYSGSHGEEIRAIFDVWEGTEEKIKVAVDQYNKAQPYCKKIYKYDCANHVITRTATGKINRKESLRRFMTQMIQKQIEDCINELVLTPVEVSGDMRLYEDLELDSFEMVHLIGILESVFHIKMDMQKVSGFLMIHDLCEYVMERIYKLDGTGVTCYVQ